MGDFDWLQGKFSAVIEQALALAAQESRRRGQFFLGVEHIFWALLITDRETIRSVLSGFELSINHVRSSIERVFETHYTHNWGRDIRITPRAEKILRIALEQAKSQGKDEVETKDIIQAILIEGNSIPLRILESLGVSKDTLLLRLQGTIQAESVFSLPSELSGICEDLTSLAEAGKLPAVIGREDEIKQVMEVLLIPEGPANPLLVGEAGVGKTAIVEGLAQRLVSETDELPARLKGSRILRLRMNSLVAGTMYRGTFELKIESLIRFLREHHKVVLFIDEIHQIVGAGSAIGAPASADEIMLAPLSRGEIRLIGATTPSRYREAIRDDTALDRRFSVITVNEPSLKVTEKVLLSVKERLEGKTGVQIGEDVIPKALEIAPRYERGHKLPDKAKQWLTHTVAQAETEGRRKITSQDLVRIVAKRTKIPEYIIWHDPIRRINRMEATLKQRIIGQDTVIQALARRIRSKLVLPQNNPTAPNGVFLFLGPTGVGKTETAKALAEFLFGDESQMIRLDMSEYKELNALSRLIGQARGIVGAKRGGILTERIRDNPYTVLLLDEFEKAHVDVLNLFLQIFDEGWVTDGLGRMVYFSDAVIIMTSNLGSDVLQEHGPVGFPVGTNGQEASEPREMHKRILTSVKRQWPSEFLNRIDAILVFDPLTEEAVKEIARLQLKSLNTALAQHGKKLLVDEIVLELLVKQGYSPEFGARELKRVLADMVEDELAEHWKEASVFKARALNEKIEIVPVATADKEEGRLDV